MSTRHPHTDVHSSSFMQNRKRLENAEMPFSK